MSFLLFTDTELSKLENSFSQFRNITILFVSWNIGATKPEHLSGSQENSSFLYDALKSVDSPDIIVFGLQEVVPLDKANVAKFIKRKKGLEGASTTLHVEHRRWADKLVGAVAFALPDERYKLLYTKELVGLLSCVMIKTKELAAARDCAAHTISRGVGNRFGNKVCTMLLGFQWAGRCNFSIGGRCGQTPYRRYFPMLFKLPPSCRTPSSSRPECGCCSDH